MARILFICPTAPRPERTGLAMRASVSVDGLARDDDLTVAVVRSTHDSVDLEWVRARASRVVEAPYGSDWRSAFSWFTSARGRRVAAGPLPTLVTHRPPDVGLRLLRRVGTSFDAVVVMGTYLSGVALPFLDEGIPGILDAFDNDARTCASLARLDKSYLPEVARFEAFQEEAFGWFHRVLFASLEDAVPHFDHLPNAVAIPDAGEARAAGSPINVLFVGNPGYLPNADALERLNRLILPALVAQGLDVALLHPTPEEDVGPLYRRSHVAVVPLRAGGGTRIKVLESFAHSCAVVSTPTGARGLSVSDGQHLVVTADDDDPRAFAQAVAELAREDVRRTRIIKAAREYVAVHHDRRLIGAQMARLVHGVISDVADAPGPGSSLS